MVPLCLHVTKLKTEKVFLSKSELAYNGYANASACKPIEQWSGIKKFHSSWQ
jgi:hypothetical protein